MTHSFSKYSLQTLFYYFVRTLKFCAYLLSLRLCISKKCQHERIDFNNQNHICLRNNKPSHKTITTMYKLWLDPFFCKKRVSPTSHHAWYFLIVISSFLFPKTNTAKADYTIPKLGLLCCVHCCNVIIIIYVCVGWCCMWLIRWQKVRACSTLPFPLCAS